MDGKDDLGYFMAGFAEGELGSKRKGEIMKKRIIFLALISVFSGCDTFFTLDALIIDDRTGGLISDAKATLVLDRGAEEPNVTEISHNDGRVSIFMNEPADAWATLTIEKEGYSKWSTQFRGAPLNKFAIRLISCDEDASNCEGGEPKDEQEH